VLYLHGLTAKQLVPVLYPGRTYRRCCPKWDGFRTSG